uniref:Uncharacterized protein n=1 Tax=Anguilla anguilla TaxID=7936 RepID=A0A0E9W7J4_ANGAN
MGTQVTLYFTRISPLLGKKRSPHTTPVFTVRKPSVG